MQQLRARAITHSLFPHTTLKAAIDRLRFVQADPIRSPARAQDLILRHRVKGYRAGTLERRYPSLDLEEDILYAYGFLPRLIQQLMLPRKKTGLAPLEKKILATLRRGGEMHPGKLEPHFGSRRVRNDWGGTSKATKRALDKLHQRGLTRVSRRENGIRVYEAAGPSPAFMSPGERFRKLVMVIATIFSPALEKSLKAIFAPYRSWVPGRGETQRVLENLLLSGALESQTIEGLRYFFLPRKKGRDDVPRTVRFLTPFDPLVWDRRRFEHLWGWPYRFEAYVPPAKRLRGYYAMPLLWGDRVIGWVNARVSEGRLGVETGFIEKRSQGRRFRSELDAEIGRLETFLILTQEVPDHHQ